MKKYQRLLICLFAALALMSVYSSSKTSAGGCLQSMVVTEGSQAYDYCYYKRFIGLDLFILRFGYAYETEGKVYWSNYEGSEFEVHKASRHIVFGPSYIISKSYYSLKPIATFGEINNL